MSHCETYGTEECDILSSNIRASLLTDGKQNIPQVTRRGHNSKVARESSPPNDHLTRENSYKGSPCGQSSIEPQYRCSYCDNGFSSLNDFSSHRETCRTKACDVLSSYTRTSLLTDWKQNIPQVTRRVDNSIVARESSPPNDHLTRENPYKGSTCGQSLIEPQYRCSNCDNGFSSLSDFSAHRKIHSEEESKKCGVNDLSLSNSTTFAHRMRIHTGEKPHKCTVCEKSVALSSRLTYHMRTHTGEKPYKCTVCEKCFFTYSHLTTHMQTHTGEKPFSCTFCLKKFSQKGTLTRHVRTHTGE